MRNTKQFSDPSGVIREFNSILTPSAQAEASVLHPAPTQLQTPASPRLLPVLLTGSGSLEGPTTSPVGCINLLEGLTDSGNTFLRLPVY